MEPGIITGSLHERLDYRARMPDNPVEIPVQRAHKLHIAVFEKWCKGVLGLKMKIDGFLHKIALKLCFLGISFCHCAAAPEVLLEEEEIGRIEKGKPDLERSNV